ncbi:hypothetical protein IVB02_32175 [Bradyrhizobium sp. 166]|uniref:hypothetical protein n=1 Tax=Bradyrhizobium sp. 166 TaxID=2782638 RepID=UPI001FFB252C|nr:hypothetical protein [Bradyrhizobium sp. 166]MCK1605938.1 hypothetical protein [Bradyrhizobium sp. 166]
MIDFFRMRHCCHRSIVEDQLRHQAREGGLGFRRQLRPCWRADAAVRQADPEQIFAAAARLSIVDCVGIRSLALTSVVASISPRFWS